MLFLFLFFCVVVFFFVVVLIEGPDLESLRTVVV